MTNADEELMERLNSLMLGQSILTYWIAFSGKRVKVLSGKK